MDKLDAMKTFVAVVNEGSFTQAADQLGFSPQLVSKYVGQLEERLAVRLLNRTTRRISLTEAGTLYFERAQTLIENFEETESLLGDYQTNAQGLLRVSAPVSFATLHLAPVVSQFHQRFPNIHIDLQLNDRKVSIIEEGFDVALRIGRLSDSSLVAKYLTPIRLVHCAAPSYLDKHGTPTHLEDLTHHRFLGYSYLEEAADQHLSKKPQTSHLTSNNGQLLAQYAIDGLGMMLQPTFIAGEAIAKGKLKVVLPEHEPAPLGLFAVYGHRKFLPSKIRCFIDFLDGYFGDTPYWDNF